MVGLRWRSLGTIALIGSLLSFGAPAPERAAYAQALPGGAVVGGEIREIRVSGTQRVDPETVLSYMTVRPGDRFDSAEVDLSLRRLFDTGLFSDVRLERRGDVLVVQVVENPIVNQIAFEGNARLDDEELLAEIQLQPRSVYTQAKVQVDVQRILEVYRRSGRFAAQVDPQLIELDQNRVDVIFEITEGELTPVESIVFVGNEAFDDGDLRSEIRTVEEAWYRFFSADDIYDPDRLAVDRELLRRFYLENGYADFRVISSVAELTPERSGFIVTFTVEEGPRYTFGTIEIESRLRELDPATLEALIEVEEGDWYDATEVERIVQAISDRLGTEGYAFADVRTRVRRDRENGTIDIVFEIGEGPRVYVERIDIEGNTRTLDRVIRRELLIGEGDAFSTERLRRSRQRLINLGFFERVEVQNEPSEEAPDRTDVTIDVQEKSTGELSFGVGFSSESGPLADVTLRERNLLGRGQDLRLGVLVSGQRSQVDLGFTEPYFLDRNISAGFDIFYLDDDFESEASYRNNAAGFNLTMGYEINEHLSQRLVYSLRRNDLDVADDASTIIQEDAGESFVSAVGQTLTYDRTDNRFEPTSGYLLSMFNELAGLGGDLSFFRNTFRAATYYTPAEEWTLSLIGNAGFVVGIGEDVEVLQRFQSGGARFRGFEFGGIGPRDVVTEDALGGKYFYVGTAELAFPLGLPTEVGLSGRAFTDVGSLWGIDQTAPTLEGEDQSVRVSVGVGLAWRSPFGPIRVDFSLPVIKEDFDKVQNIYVSFGTRF